MTPGAPPVLPSRTGRRAERQATSDDWPRDTIKAHAFRLIRSG
jgi:hypothetical protein